MGGIGYGIVHRRTLQAREDARFEKSEIKRKEDLIKKAKEAYRNKLADEQARKSGLTSEFCASGKRRGESIQSRQSDSQPSSHLLCTVETNPDSPNFDLEKFLNSLDK